MMNIEKMITRQIARCLAIYGDNPDALMNRLETLVMRWYMHGKDGFTIYCPHCKGYTIVNHFDWSAIGCMNCNEYVDLEEWKIEE